MAYNSSHTGAQIDSAVGAVIEKETTWDDKQDALTGKSGQVVGFDADGKPKATDAPSGGMTEAEADAKYLPLAGGTLTDKFELSAPLGATTFTLRDNHIELDANEMGTGGINIAGGDIARVRISAHQYQTDDSAELIVDGDAGWVTITSSQGGSGIVATRPKAHKVTLTAAGWDSSTKQQTVNCADVVASETAQQILPMPAAASMAAYNNAGIQCVAQAAGKLTFQCETVPTAAIDVYVTITPVAFS